MRSALAAVLLLFPGISSAGLFSSSLSVEDAASVHKIAVLSLLGDTLHLNTYGLTVFGNKGGEVPVPQWRMDAAATERTVQQLQGGNRFAAEALDVAPASIEWSQSGTFMGPSKAGRRLILDRAAAQGVDAVLLIEREANAHDRSVGPGFGLYNRHLLGKDHVYLMASLAVVLIRVPGDKVLAQQHPDPLTPHPIPWAAQTSWSELTPAQQSELESSIKEAVFARIDSVLMSMNLVPKTNN